MTVSLGRIVIYTKRVEAMVAFYCDHFGFDVLGSGPINSAQSVQLILSVPRHI